VALRRRTRAGGRRGYAPALNFSRASTRLGLDAVSLVGLHSPPERFLTREELAAELRVHVHTLDRLRREPNFPEEHWGPRTIRFQLGPVLAWLRERDQRRREAA
jgi:predicted DNA-binding transcriptional regulator AlpA